MWIMEALMLSRVWIMRALIPSAEHRFTAALPSGNPAPWIGAYITGLPSAPGQPLIVQALRIVIRQHHTLSARPGIWCTGAWTAVGWISAEQAKTVVGRWCLKYANIFSAFDFPQFSSLMSFWLWRHKIWKTMAWNPCFLYPDWIKQSGLLDCFAH